MYSQPLQLRPLSPIEVRNAREEIIKIQSWVSSTRRDHNKEDPRVAELIMNLMRARQSLESLL